MRRMGVGNFTVIATKSLERESSPRRTKRYSKGRLAHISGPRGLKKKKKKKTNSLQGAVGQLLGRPFRMKPGTEGTAPFRTDNQKPGSLNSRRI